MKIVIDATGVTKQKTGVGVYAKNLIDAMSRTTGDRRLYILAQDDDPEMDFSSRANVEMLWVSARFFRLLPLRFLLEQICLPYLLWKRQIDVLHSLHYAFPLLRTRAKRVVTFHDMTFINMPEVHERIKVFYFRFFMRAAARKADAVIFISQSVKNDFIDLFGRTKALYPVIPHGKDEQFERVTDLVDTCRQNFDIPARFALYIGTIEPRKNLERLVTAFASVCIRDKDIALVFVGKLGWMMQSLKATIDRLGLAPRVIFTGFISEADKMELLSSCTLFIYPSLYEGFGLPVLEALACGAPTITSNISALPEVAGDAALLINPLKVDELVTAMNSLLLDGALREELRTRGLVQARKFSWMKAAAETEKVYRSVAVTPHTSKSLAIARKPVGENRE